MPHLENSVRGIPPIVSQPHVLALVTLLLLSCGAPRSVPAPVAEPHPQDLPLSGQLRMHHYDGERIAAALPGYVTFEDASPCLLIVYLADTASMADSARALFRHALPYEGYASLEECPGERARVEVRRSEYTRAQRAELLRRLQTVLSDSLIRLKGEVTAGPEKFIVWGQNFPALGRARARLEQEAWVPHDKLVFQLYDREEVDRPAAPPRDAYLLVLDSLGVYSRRSLGRIPMDSRSLPSIVGDSDLLARGLRPSTRADSCATPGSVISFLAPLEFVDGSYRLGLRQGMSNTYYEVRCSDRVCAVTRRFLGNEDYIVLGCATAEFGNAALAGQRRTLRRTPSIPPKGWR